jgi:hypothetical protein
MKPNFDIELLPEAIEFLENLEKKFITILKKTQKTPIKEINKAEEIRKEYLDYQLKNKNNGK